MTILVRLLVAEPAPEGPPTVRELATVELARLPAAYEWLSYAGTEHRITSVRHVVGADVAADVHVEVLSELAMSGNASKQRELGAEQTP